MVSQNRRLLALAWIQAAFYITSGLWPVFEVDSFMVITGPKVDVWLVRTVGALLAVTGLVLGWAAKRRQISPDLAAIAVGQAFVLAAVDLVYAGNGRISPVYLADAGVELILGAAWLFWYPWRQPAGVAARPV